MREWWRYNVEEWLDRLPVNWDMVFLWMWLFYAVKVILSGGSLI